MNYNITGFANANRDTLKKGKIFMLKTGGSAFLAVFYLQVYRHDL